MTYEPHLAHLKIFQGQLRALFELRTFPIAFAFASQLIVIFAMSFEVHPDTTGFYQSQTATTNSSKSPTQTSDQVNRKRPLDDVSNMQPQRSRSCKQAASEKIHSWTAKQAPQGNPKRAAAAREARKTAPPSV